MIQKRRSSSADGRRWLAHTPDDTVRTNTVLQVFLLCFSKIYIYIEIVQRSEKILVFSSTHQIVNYKSILAIYLTYFYKILNN